MIDELGVSNQELGVDNVVEYRASIEPLSVPVLQAALEVERHGREWLEQALATRQAERDELRREVERLRAAFRMRESNGGGRAEPDGLREEVGRLRSALRTSETAVAALNERVTTTTAEVADVTERAAMLERDRCALRRQLTEVTGQLSAAVLKRDTLIRERDALAREVQAARAQVGDGRVDNGVGGDEPAVEARPADGAASVVPELGALAAARGAGSQPTLEELGRSLELIAESIGSMRVWAQEVASSEELPPAAMVVLEDRLRLLLAPLVALPGLQREVARLGTRLDTLAGGDQPAGDDVLPGAAPVMQEAPAESVSVPIRSSSAPGASSGAPLGGTHAPIESGNLAAHAQSAALAHPCRACEEQRLEGKAPAPHPSLLVRRRAERFS
jgi:hypothetical protein